MRANTCAEIEDLIEREALGWSEADRLRVEQHLHECEACRETLSLSRFVRDTLREAAGELSESARSRAIMGALAHQSERAVARKAQRRWLGASFGAAFLAAAAAVLLWWNPGASGPVAKRAPKTEPQIPAANGTDAEKEPTHVAATAPKEEQGSATEPVSIDAVLPEQRTLAHAEVAFDANTRAHFDPATHTLELAHGRVDVEVDPTRGEPFAVVTEHFRVEVLGTHFAVTPESVSVAHGRVQVFARDGGVLARELSAGATFYYKRPSAAKASRGAQPKAATSDVAQPEAAKSAGSYLNEARAALGRGDSQAARDLLDQAERARPTRSERAEAQTLRAEAYLLARDSSAALRVYRDVADHYAELAAGDNAAFAAAQLAARADKPHERELLERYLSRFPNGRFRDEAKQRLERLK